MSSSSSRFAGHAPDRFANALTALFAIGVLALLSTLVLSRKANLAWDDADYLRRGLTNARFAEESGPLLIAPRARFRLRGAAWVVVQLLLFGLVGVALADVGRPLLGALLGGAATVDLALLLVFGGADEPVDRLSHR